MPFKGLHLTRVLSLPRGKLPFTFSPKEVYSLSKQNTLFPYE